MDWDADGGGYLTIATSTLKNSTAFVGPGGAIAAFNAAGSGAGTLELDSSTVTGNNTPEAGGGIYVTTQVPLVLNATTVSSNQACQVDQQRRSRCKARTGRRHLQLRQHHGYRQQHYQQQHDHRQ